MSVDKTWCSMKEWHVTQEVSSQREDSLTKDSTTCLIIFDHELPTLEIKITPAMEGVGSLLIGRRTRILREICMLRISNIKKNTLITQLLSEWIIRAGTPKRTVVGRLSKNKQKIRGLVVTSVIVDELLSSPTGQENWELVDKPSATG